MITQQNQPPGHPPQGADNAPLVTHDSAERPPRELAGAKRIALRLQAIRQSALPLILQVTHGMGGGVERHVRELYALLQGRASVLILRPGTVAGLVRLAFDAANGADQLDFKLPEDGELLRRTLLAAGLSRIHIHHVFGFPESVWGLLQALERPVDITLHDYAIVAGNPTLTNGKGIYSGWRTNSDFESKNPGHANRLRALAASAQRCLVPSWDMHHRLSLALPWLRTQVRPHPDRECFGAYPVPHPPRLELKQPLRVLCLGALGREKGVEVLRSVAVLARRRGLLIEFRLLGSAHISLGADVVQLGSYQDQQLLVLLARERPHLLWFPVRCPETWSYTLSAALEAGAPVLASDLGAFAERLEGRPLSWLQSYDCSAEAWLGVMLGIREQLMAMREECVEEQALGWCQDKVPAFYTADYLSAENQCETIGILPSLHYWQRRHVSPDCVTKAADWRSQLLAWAMRIREWPLVGALLSRIPYNLQRKIKRKVSSAPLN